jgi:hypothetical protein
MFIDLLLRQRDDIVVPSDLLDDAAAALLTNGWRYSPTKLPLPHTPDRCRSGWDIVAKYSRLFRYPASYGARSHELLVLLSCFVGLEHEPLSDNTKFSRFSQNIYCPSAHLMAISVARTHIRNSLKTTLFGTLMFSWASYFWRYSGFEVNELEGRAEGEVVDWWRRLASEEKATECT